MAEDKDKKPMQLYPIDGQETRKRMIQEGIIEQKKSHKVACKIGIAGCKVTSLVPYIAGAFFIIWAIVFQIDTLKYIAQELLNYQYYLDLFLNSKQFYALSVIISIVATIAIVAIGSVAPAIFEKLIDNYCIVDKDNKYKAPSEIAIMEVKYGVGYFIFMLTIYLQYWSYIISSAGRLIVLGVAMVIPALVLTETLGEIENKANIKWDFIDRGTTELKKEWYSIGWIFAIIQIIFGCAIFSIGLSMV
jgi:hypothetical protein